jgi:hypothetical protein
MASALVNILQPLLSPSPVIIPQDNKDPNKLLAYGCFVDCGAPVRVPLQGHGRRAPEHRYGRKYSVSETSPW